MGNYASGFICYGFSLNLDHDNFSFDQDEDLPKELDVRPVGIVDRSTYVLFVTRSLLRGDSASMKFVPEELVAHEDWDKLLVDFAKKYNLEHEEPSWLLGSYYG